MNLENACAKINDVTHIDARKIREYILEHIDMIGIEKNLLRSRKSPGEITNDSPFNFPDDCLSFLIGIIKKRSSIPFKRMRQRKYIEADLDERVWVIDGWLNILRSLETPKNIIEKQGCLIDARLWVTYSWACGKLMNLHRELLDDIWISQDILAMDKRLLSQYIVKNSEQPDEELRELFDEFKEYRIDERGEYASSVAKNRSYDQPFYQDYIINQKLANDEKFLNIERQITEFSQRSGILYRDKSRLNKLIAKKQAIIDSYREEFGDDYVAPPELICECAHPLVVLKECLATIKERNVLFIRR